MGTFFIWQSGTPLNEFGPSSLGLPHYVFLRQRGSAGRSPAIWDLNLRLTYELGNHIRTVLKPKLTVDVFHLFSQRESINIDQVRYLARDENGNPASPNPNYGRTILYQPPMTVRLGMELDF